MRRIRDTARTGDGWHAAPHVALTARKPPSSRGFLKATTLTLLVSVSLWWTNFNARLAAADKAPEGKSEKGDKKGGKDGKGATGPIPVVAGTVAKKDVPIYFDGLGTVQAFNTVTVRSRVDGQLKKIAFEEGQEIHAGDLLAEIDPDPFRTQVEINEAKKRQDQAQLVNAKLDLKRNEELLSNKIVSQQVYDSAKALVDQFEATVNADQAAVESAKVQLNYATIKSPIDGRIGIRSVDQGNIVHASDANGLVVIAQLKPISLVFTLPAQMLNEIHQQMDKGELKVLAVDRDNKTVLSQGKLAVIDNQIDTSTGTIKLKATFPNQEERLWPGQFVNARLLVSTRKDGIVVPAAVIQRGPEGAYAFVIKEDSSVQIRPVKVGQTERGETLIEQGLKPGERVVVDGQYKLQAGSKVKPSKSANDEEGEDSKEPKSPKGTKQP
jgi:multidrug efflux system membrane fusion protein